MLENDRRFDIMGEDIKITVEGKGALFGGLDLQVNAIKTMIEMMDFKFAEEADEYARDKV
jgi:hypothetical protein